MEYYAPWNPNWNPNGRLASVEEILSSESESDTLSITSDESELKLVDSEYRTTKLPEAAELDTDG